MSNNCIPKIVHGVLKSCPVAPPPKAKTKCVPRIVKGADGKSRLLSCPPQKTKCVPRIVKGADGKSRLHACPPSVALARVIKNCVPRIVKGADGRSRLLSCPPQTWHPPAPPPKAPPPPVIVRKRTYNLKEVIATALAHNATTADRTLTAGEVGQIWNTLDVKSATHRRAYQRLIYQIKTGTVRLTPSARRFVWNVGGWIKQSWPGSPMASVKDEGPEARAYSVATFEAYDNYKKFRISAMNYAAGTRSNIYTLTGRAIAYSVRLFYEPPLFPFRMLGKREPLHVNLDASKHYMAARPERVAIPELRRLADTAMTEEGWLQVVIQPKGDGPQKTLFYEIGTKELAGEVTHGFLWQALRHASRQGRILRVRKYHIHPGVGYKDSDYTRPPSEADLISLHGTAKDFQQDRPDLPLPESGVVSDKAHWILSLTRKGLAATPKQISDRATTAVKCMLSANAVSAIQACYNRVGDFKLAYQAP